MNRVVVLFIFFSFDVVMIGCGPMGLGIFTDMTKILLYWLCLCVWRRACVYMYNKLNAILVKWANAWLWLWIAFDLILYVLLKNRMLFISDFRFVSFQFPKMGTITRKASIEFKMFRLPPSQRTAFLVWR